MKEKFDCLMLVYEKTTCKLNLTYTIARINVCFTNAYMTKGY